MCDSYNEMITLNWDFRFKKFKNAIFSWSSRILDTLQQRIEVIRLFALSRVYYISSILPIRSAMVKKFESLMGKFVWQGSGKILRVALDELKNEHMSGGLNLPCLATMSNALLSSQCCRLLRSGDQKSIAHMDFWLGSLLNGVVPLMGLGEQAVDIPEYFSHLGNCLASLMISELLSSSTLAKITNKMIYKDLASFKTPKVVSESLLDYKLVWRRLHSTIVNHGACDVMFLLIHNKLPVPERLFRIGVKQDPYCLLCPGAMIADIEHFFCGCERTRQCWSWIRLKILGFCDQGLQSSDWELLNLFLPRSQFEQEIVWLVTNYVRFVWTSRENSLVKFEKFFGFLTFKYKFDKNICGLNLGPIPGLG